MDSTTGHANNAFNDIDINEDRQSTINSEEEKVDIPEDVERYTITKSGKIKYPRRLIHCSDGILEEYSTDEEEEDEPEPVVVDTTKLTWGAYFWYQTVRGATNSLAACDFMGEKLAWFFGITQPKFQSAISEFERMTEEEKQQNDLEQMELDAEIAIIQNHLKESGDGNSSTSTKINIEQE